MAVFFCFVSLMFSSYGSSNRKGCRVPAVLSTKASMTSWSVAQGICRRKLQLFIKFYIIIHYFIKFNYWPSSCCTLVCNFLKIKTVNIISMLCLKYTNTKLHLEVVPPHRSFGTSRSNIQNEAV